MSFIAVPPNPSPEADIDCGAFFPAISPVGARAALRLDGTVTKERLREALVTAALSVMGELQTWADGQIAAGRTTLADVPGVEVDGIKAPVHRWYRAVHSLAGASLTERLRDYDTTNEGHQQAEKLTDTIDELRRDARWAISGILGIGRCTIELI